VPASGNTLVRVWVVGFGTVGQWLISVLAHRAAELQERYGVRFQVVGLANRRDGFVYRDGGIDLSSALASAAEGRSIRELAGVRHWETALEGMRATEADVLAEVSASPAVSGEPGRSHLEEALGRGIPVVTSNKWPVALHGVELAQLGRRHSIPLRAESTVMSGTPVISTMSEGLAGATPVALRGVLNATANYILSEMSRGSTYGAALAQAQRTGLAERDPTADVDGHDAVAKLMILSALVFGHQLRLAEVTRRGISSVTEQMVSEARSRGRWIREVATLERHSQGRLVARVEPVELEADDRLAGIDGTDNALICRARPLGEITVIGPGAGIELAGQGVLSDLLSVVSHVSPPTSVSPYRWHTRNDY
jgi:homoserine dehydrogenase